MAITSASGGKYGKWDNRNPRSSTMKATLKQKLSADEFAKYERLEACHYNGMENFPIFAAAVILGNMAGLQENELTRFAVSFLAVRVAYTVVYISNTTKALSACRSLLWMTGVSLCMRTLVRAAGAMGTKL
ncbi:hypothetical protein NX059_006753 [Plenodomus lindquistii]|nr:hypothetical protein NX059_006753 [Plenodomus lindquistii]